MRTATRCALLFAAALAVPALGAPIYMKFDGVDGEFQVESAQLAQIEQQAAAATKNQGGNNLRMHVPTFSFTHHYDKASPVLMKASSQGKHFPTVVLTARKAGASQHEYLVIKMNDVIVTSVQPSGGGGGQGTESITINFSTMMADYKPEPAAVKNLQAAPGSASRAR